MKIFGIVLFAIGCALLGGFVGFREAYIVQGKTAPLLALKYMVNLKKLDAGESKQKYWSMYSEIDLAINQYAASYDDFSLLCMLPSNSFLNETYAIKKLLEFRIPQLQKMEHVTEFEKYKLDAFVKLAEKISR